MATSEGSPDLSLVKLKLLMALTSRRLGIQVPFDQCLARKQLREVGVLAFSCIREYSCWFIVTPRSRRETRLNVPQRYYVRL
jgi:hypothetical protein